MHAAKSYGIRNNNWKMLYAMDYKDIDELLQAAMKQLEESPPAEIVWSQLSWLCCHRCNSIEYRHHGGKKQ